MKFSRTILALTLALFTVLSYAQAWSDAYSTGLRAAKDGNWGAARAAFQQAVSLRGEDFSSATRLPGPVTEQRVWRGGAPYSANFGAAYAGFKAAQGITDDAEKQALLNTVAAEFEALLARNQMSRESFFFLAQTYAATRNVQKQQELEGKFRNQNGRFPWRIDAEIIAPEDRAAIDQLYGPAMQPMPDGSIRPAQNGPSSPLVNVPAAVRAEKFALLIGNSETQLGDLKVPFAATDAMLLRERLMQFSGYDERNIDVVANATAAQMLESAKALADRVPVGATVFIFFSGVGANLDGRDFLAGVDTASGTDSATMLAKQELYRLFMAKGCKIFAFFQTHRPVQNGRFFGQETPMVGAIAQTQATIPGGKVSSINVGGNPVGLFTDAIGGVLGEFRSNQVPIMEFGWRVFNWMRGGRNGESGTGSSQTMTLPVIVNMREDERF